MYLEITEINVFENMNKKMKDEANINFSFLILMIYGI